METQNLQSPSQSWQWAQWYGQQGLAVFPLAPKTKIPRKGSNGFRDATKDPVVISRLWAEVPDANIAVATGTASGFLVLDIDGQTGWQSFARLQNQLGPLPITATVITPGKIKDGKHTGQGHHLYFRLPTDITLDSRNAIAENIDLKAERGYVVLPPSIHPDGTGTYQYAQNLALNQIPIAELPKPWIEFFVAATTKKQLATNMKDTIANSENSPPQSPIDSETVVLDDQLLKRIIPYVEKCAPAIRGQGGHATLLTLANVLVHGFCLNPSEAADFAWERYNPKCSPPWTDAERSDFDRKFTEAADKPPDKPRGWLLNGNSSKTASQGRTAPSMPGNIVLNPERTKRSAEMFVCLHHIRNNIQTLYYWSGDFYTWHNNAYRLISETRLRAEILSFLDAAYIEINRKGVIALEPFPAKKSHVDNVIDALKGIAYLDSNTSVPCWLGGDPMPVSDPSMILFGKTRNLDIVTMKVFDASPEWFNFNAIDIDYEDIDMSLSRCPRWDEFLHELFGDDAESKLTLLMFMGLLLIANTKFQKAMLVVGPKRSGKGTIARIVRKLVGDINLCGPTTEGLASHFGLQQLIAKTVAIVSDARFSGPNMSVLTERILAVTGEDTLTIDRKHRSALTMRLLTRFLFLSNELPRLTDSAGALAGRFIVLKLTKSFYGQEDLELETKLLAELPGILAQVVAALRDLLQQGRFKQPESARDEVQLLENLTSPIAHFVSDRCEVGDAANGMWTSTDDLFSAWRTWCEAEGYQGVGTKSTFCRNLIAAIPKLTKQRPSGSGAGRPWGYTGIRLISMVPSYYEDKPCQ